MHQMTPASTFNDQLVKDNPAAIAWVSGLSSEPQLNGSVRFYETPYRGILIEAEIFGLPNIRMVGSSDFYAMHIHEFGDCAQPLNMTGNHYNPMNTMHPSHAGDLVPLLGNQGYAYLVFYDKRFTIDDIIGRSVIIHRNPDDFATQPSGNSGEKIACGVIRRV